MRIEVFRKAIKQDRRKGSTGKQVSFLREAPTKPVHMPFVSIVSKTCCSLVRDGHDSVAFSREQLLLLLLSDWGIPSERIIDV